MICVFEPRGILNSQVKVIQEAIPGKKNRVVFLGDESDEIKAVLGAVPSGVLVANNIAPGTLLRLLDYTACQVKDKWALMVSSLEVAECLDQQMAENDAKKDESSELKQEVVKEEVKDETAVKDQEMEEPSTKVEQGAREESKSETVEEKGPAKKVRIMTETDSNRPAASPLPTKPEAAATPGSAAAKVPPVSPAQKGATPKENATPPSG